MNILKKIHIKKESTYNLWLKIISLVIAILVWLYVNGVITGRAQRI